MTISAEVAPIRAPADTFLGRLPDSLAEALLAGSTTLMARAGESIFATRDGRMGVVVAGLVRAHLIAADGRQLTVRYGRPGALIGTLSDPSGDRAPVRLEAVTDTVVTELDASRLDDLARSNPAVASALVVEIGRRLDDAYTALATNAFGTMRERIARHLLDRARSDGMGPGAIVDVTQQQLADDIGTAREVVARVLRELRVDGLVVTRSGAIEIHDRERLAALVGGWRSPPSRQPAPDPR